ncbi:MAG: hypothetical protein GY696_25260 [Gammaproteobacteria bacterium]|nr:hypothetical protein [Gammaproteobacteria bacterium]
MPRSEEHFDIPDAREDATPFNNRHQSSSKTDSSTPTAEVSSVTARKARAPETSHRTSGVVPCSTPGQPDEMTPPAGDSTTSAEGITTPGMGESKTTTVSTLEIPTVQSCSEHYVTPY